MLLDIQDTQDTAGCGRDNAEECWCPEFISSAGAAGCSQVYSSKSAQHTSAAWSSGSLSCHHRPGPPQNGLLHATAAIAMGVMAQACERGGGLPPTGASGRQGCQAAAQQPLARLYSDHAACTCGAFNIPHVEGCLALIQ